MQTLKKKKKHNILGGGMQWKYVFLGIALILIAVFSSVAWGISAETINDTELVPNAQNSFTTKVTCDVYGDKYKQGDIVYLKVLLCYGAKCIEEVNKQFVYEVPCPEMVISFKETIPSKYNDTEITKVKLLTLIKRFDMPSWDIKNEKEVKFVSAPKPFGIPELPNVEVKTSGKTITLTMNSLLTWGLILIGVGLLVFLFAKPFGILIMLIGFIMMGVFFFV